MASGEVFFLKIAAISRLQCPHHIDHLAPLCAAFSAEFLSSEKEEIALIKQSYPDIFCRYVAPHELGPFYLTRNVDIAIHSFPWPKKLLHAHPFAKKSALRLLFTPHGYSDKPSACSTWQDYQHNALTLIYGPKMQKELQEEGIDKNLFFMSNLRYLFYQKHQAFFDIKAAKFFSKIDKKKPLLLFAPSWSVGSFPSSLHSLESFLFRYAAKEFSILIKLHPWQKKKDISQVYRLIEKSKDHPSVTVIDGCTPTYPLLQKATCFLGDASSLGYDFLLLDKPLFFYFPPEISLEKWPLHRCGQRLFLHNPKEAVRLLLDYEKETIEKRAIRKKTAEEVFGTKTSFDEIKKTLQHQIKEVFYR